MKRWIVLFAAFKVLTMRPMEIPIDENETIQEEYQSQNSSLSSSPETISSLSSSPVDQFFSLNELNLFKSKAFFFCHICDKEIRQDPENFDYIEHLILVHQACAQCAFNHKMVAVFKNSDLVRKHIKKCHVNPISHPNPTVSLMEQMMQQVKEDRFINAQPFKKVSFLLTK